MWRSGQEKFGFGRGRYRGGREQRRSGTDDKAKQVKSKPQQKCTGNRRADRVSHTTLDIMFSTFTQYGRHLLLANRMHADDERTSERRKKTSSAEQNYGSELERVFSLSLAHCYHTYLYTLRRTLCQARACKVVEKNTQKEERKHTE